MAFLKPQSPLIKGNDYFYPLTTADQVIMSNNIRLTDVFGQKITRTIILSQNNWSEVLPYSQNIICENLTNKTPFKISLKYPEGITIEEKIIYKKEFEKISYYEQNENTLIFECWEEIPNTDLYITLEMSFIYPFEKDTSGGNESDSFIPRPTAEDEGKILKVVNGAPKWVTVLNVEEGEY